ncbi:hypothetical protein COO60DRAFT_1541530, partial [Scenedesmus sp. NREL 46B-D3]
MPGPLLLLLLLGWLLWAPTAVAAAPASCWSTALYIGMPYVPKPSIEQAAGVADDASAASSSRRSMSITSWNPN